MFRPIRAALSISATLQVGEPKQIFTTRYSVIRIANKPFSKKILLQYC